jgi:serine/threonine-protein kinase
MDVPASLGKYEIRGTLGRGAMGVVYDGWDPQIARRVAVKSVPLPTSHDPETAEEIARFRREAQAAGRLTHPNIVGVYDYGETADLAYIVMEYVDGPTLKALLDKRERFPLDSVRRIMGDVLAGLQFSHDRGVVHRDIKPGNIMLTADGQAKIADFGIARIEMSSLTQAGTMVGTPAYMSPEQFRGEVVDARSDIYSAGVLLYQLLTGERPFEGGLTAIMHKVLNTEPPVPSQLAGTVPRALDAVVQKAMAKRPQERFASAAAFADALRAAIAAPAAAPLADDDEATLVRGPVRPPAVKAMAPAPAPSPPPAKASGSRLSVLAGVAVIAVVALAGAGWFLVPRAPPAATQATGDTTGQGGAKQGTISGGSTEGHPAQGNQTQGDVAKADTKSGTTQGDGTAGGTTQGDGTAGGTAKADSGKTDTTQASTKQEVATTTGGGATTGGSARTDAGKSDTIPGGTAQVGSTQGVSAQGGASSQGGATPGGTPKVDASKPDTTQGGAKQTDTTSTPSGTTPDVTTKTDTTKPDATAHDTSHADDVKTASVAPVAMLQRIGQALHGARCALADATLQDTGGLSVSGLSDAATGESLRRQLGEVPGIPTIAWRMQTVDPVFCPTLAMLQPISPLGGGPGPGVGLTLRGNRTVLQDGEAILPRVTMPDFAGELRVDYLAHDGSLAHLYPTAADPAAKLVAQPSRRLSAGERIALGDPGPGKPQWASGTPYGTDMIIAVASSVPLHVSAPNNAEDKGDAYLAELGRAIEQARASGARVSGGVLLVDAVPKAK